MIVNSSTFNFKDTVDGVLRSYRQEIVEAGYEVIPQVAKEAAAKLRKTAPRRPGGGKYAKGWAAKNEKGRLRVVSTVYGKTGTYQLAHLLEHGHALRGGGRHGGQVIHIAPVEEWATKEAYDRMMDKVQGI